MIYLVGIDDLRRWIWGQRLMTVMLGALFIPLLLGASISNLSLVGRTAAPWEGHTAQFVTAVHLPLPPQTVHGLAVLGDTVAWSSESSGPFYTLFSASLRTRQARVVARGTAAEPTIGDTLLSPHWLVWLELEPLHLAWRIIALDRRTQQRVTVDGSARERGLPDSRYLAPMLSLDGDTLVYSFSTTQQGQPHTAIYAQTLPHGPRRLLAESVISTCVLRWPTVSGQTAAWEQVGGCSGGGAGSDIVVADLSRGRPYLLTTDHQSSQPVTNGQLVAYKGQASQERAGSIIVVDRRTNQRHVIDGSGNANFPELTDHLVAGRPMAHRSKLTTYARTNTMSSRKRSTHRRAISTLNHPGNAGAMRSCSTRPRGMDIACNSS